MEIENSSLMSSDDISTITAGSIEHATDTSAATEEPSITDELKPYGLHLSTGVPTIVFDPEENFIASSKPIPPDDFAPTNLYCYIARSSRSKHHCCLCTAEIGTGIF